MVYMPSLSMTMLTDNCIVELADVQEAATDNCIVKLADVQEAATDNCIVKLADVQEAAKRISPYIHRTPVIVNPDFNERYGRNFHFKAESMQRTGSFKIRGALNAVLKIVEKNGDVEGFVANSSGNHGRALAWIGRTLGLRCVVVCPNTVPEYKQADITDLGAEVVICDPSPDERKKCTETIARERGYHFISTSDDYDIIAGQGTMALELLQQVPGLDAVLVPASGGGLLAGTCVTAKAINPHIKIFAVEPFGKDLERCLRAGERLWPMPARTIDTVADGMRMQQLGLKTWPIALQHAEKRVFTVTDDDVIDSMKFAFNHLKLVIEPSAATTVAVARSQSLANMDPSLKNIGVVLSGGNADLDTLPWQ